MDITPVGYVPYLSPVSDLSSYVQASAHHAAESGASAGEPTGCLEG